VNVLILAAGKPNPELADSYPLCLTEIEGSPLIERILGACARLNPSKIIVAIRREDARRHHLDNVVKLLCANAEVVTVSDKVQGAACSALLAAPYTDNDEPLLILNGDSLLTVDFATVINDFMARQLDAGTIAFPSVHPRYSYVRLDESGLVVEAAEKNPISREATAGFYWYRHGKDFVAAAKSMIRKDANVGGFYFICPAFNELVLKHQRIGIFRIEGKQYHQLKTEKQVNLYYAQMDQERG